MTRVVVNAGACGFSVTITAEKQKDGSISLSLDTDCEMVRELGEDLPVIERFAPLAGYRENPVHRAAAKRLKHASCVVPSAILKAIEVEAGLNVARDMSITFEKKK